MTWWEHLSETPLKRSYSEENVGLERACGSTFSIRMLENIGVPSTATTSSKGLQRYSTSGLTWTSRQSSVGMNLHFQRMPTMWSPMEKLFLTGIWEMLMEFLHPVLLTLAWYKGKLIKTLGRSCWAGQFSLEVRSMVQSGQEIIKLSLHSLRCQSKCA